MIDATYTPVNNLEDDQADVIIGRDFPLLLEDLRRHAAAETGIVLVKANVCALLESSSKMQGSTLPTGESGFPFPGQAIKANSALPSARCYD